MVTPRSKTRPLDTKYFSGEVRCDTHYRKISTNRRPSIGGVERKSSGLAKSSWSDLSIGGDFPLAECRGRVLDMYGMFAVTTPRNDASAAVGQWDSAALTSTYRKRTADTTSTCNMASISMRASSCRISACSAIYNFDNWTYQPSYVSSNTPWFFNGLRVQWFPSQQLKIEPWFINGWQSYNKFNGHPGLGGQLTGLRRNG